MSLPFCPPPWVRRHPRRGARHVPAVRRRRIPPAEVQRKTLRPERANPPAAVRVPRWVGAEKELPGKGEPANAVRVPRWVGAEKEPPVRANTLTQFECPGQPVQKRSRPVRANPPAAVRVPRWVDAENPGNPEKIFPPEKAAKTPILTLRKRLSERYS